MSFDEISIAYRLSNIVCGSMCAADDVCNAFKYWPRNCSLANATGLVGALPNSSIAETVMIIITLKFRFYYKERAGIFHGMSHKLG